MTKNILNPNDLIIKTKNQISEWLEDFEKVREQILASNDMRKNNYNFRRFKLKEQEEITVAYLSGKIIAFSSLYHRNYYQGNISRVLNRSWKSTEIRHHSQSYSLIGKHMLQIQLKKALTLNKSVVFISVEGKKRWLKNFTHQLQKSNSQWVYQDRLYKVAPGNNPSCWQYITFLPLKQEYKPHFLYKTDFNNG